MCVKHIFLKKKNNKGKLFNTVVQIKKVSHTQTKLGVETIDYSRTYVENLKNPHKM